MKYVPVTSSNIATVGYEPASRILEIGFKNGGRYSYSGVPPEKAAELAFGDSPGSYFANSIKPHHQCEKLEPNTFTHILQSYECGCRILRKPNDEVGMEWCPAHESVAVGSGGDL